MQFKTNFNIIIFEKKTQKKPEIKSYFKVFSLVLWNKDLSCSTITLIEFS